MSIVAVLAMIMAVILYTTGVFSERKAGILKQNHIIIFWSGLFFDTLGTTAMGKISNGISFDFHGITGVLALMLMLLHVIWVTTVFTNGKDKQKKIFINIVLLFGLYG